MCDINTLYVCICTSKGRGREWRAREGREEEGRGEEEGGTCSKVFGG